MITFSWKKLYRKSVPKLLCEWLKSFLFQRRKRVRVPGFPCSQWLFLNEGMPQGSLLGPISFIIHTDDLSPRCNILKYVDDTTLSEIIASSSSVSNMQSLIGPKSIFDLGRLTAQKPRRWYSAALPRETGHYCQFMAHPWKEFLSTNSWGFFFISADLRWETHKFKDTSSCFLCFITLTFVNIVPASVH